MRADRAGRTGGSRRVGFVCRERRELPAQCSICDHHFVYVQGHWGVVPSAVCRAVASVWSSCIRLCDRWRSPSGAAVKVAEDGLHVLLSVVKRVLGVETVYAWGARAHDDEESRETVHFLAVGTRADSAGWHVIDAVRATGPWGVRGARVGPGCVVE
jgi:hypothetical protein